MAVGISSDRPNCSSHHGASVRAWIAGATAPAVQSSGGRDRRAATAGGAAGRCVRHRVSCTAALRRLRATPNQPPLKPATASARHSNGRSGGITLNRFAKRGTVTTSEDSARGRRGDPVDFRDGAQTAARLSTMHPPDPEAGPQDPAATGRRVRKPASHRPRCRSRRSSDRQRGGRVITGDHEHGNPRAWASCNAAGASLRTGSRNPTRPANTKGAGSSGNAPLT